MHESQYRELPGDPIANPVHRRFFCATAWITMVVSPSRFICIACRAFGHRHFTWVQSRAPMQPGNPLAAFPWRMRSTSSSRGREGSSDSLNVVSNKPIHSLNFKSMFIMHRTGINRNGITQTISTEEQSPKLFVQS